MKKFHTITVNGKAGRKVQPYDLAAKLAKAETMNPGAVITVETYYQSPNYSVSGR